MTMTPSRFSPVSLNPLACGSEEAITDLLRQICGLEGDTLEERIEIDDQLEALVPALIELRDAGHIMLNMAVATSYSTLEGFMRLAGDERLTPLSRSRCTAIRNRLLVRILGAVIPGA